MLIGVLALKEVIGLEILVDILSVVLLSCIIETQGDPN